MTAALRTIVAGLPTSPGVYLFYGASGELLYVGKSKSIRTRVRSHFTARDEAWLRRRVRRVDTRETAGELGALLLESKLIKELHPMFNVASRQRRRIIVARGSLNAGGYLVISLEAIDALHLRPDSPVMGIFKHRTQAREFLSQAARDHRLCPKLLRIETGRGYCFSYHLGQCDGACNGEEDPAAYNKRVEQAFDERRIRAWPYAGAIVIEEESPAGLRESFVIDNWCLLESRRSNARPEEATDPTPHRFDYDSYKILYTYLSDPANAGRISVRKRETGLPRARASRSRRAVAASHQENT